MTRTVRYIARGTAIFALSMFLLIFIGEGPPSPSQLRPHEIVMFAFLGLTMLGGLVAFRWEGIGSAVILLGFVAFTATNPQILKMPAFFFFLIPGLLFGYCWLMAWRKRKAPPT